MVSAERHLLTQSGNSLCTEKGLDHYVVVEETVLILIMKPNEVEELLPMYQDSTKGDTSVSAYCGRDATSEKRRKERGILFSTTRHT